MNRSDPVENLNSYVMVHGGIDRQERLLDIEWVREVVSLARELTNTFGEEEQGKVIDSLRKVVRQHGGYNAGAG